MASSTGAPSGGDIIAKSSRRYLDIQPIRLYELPLHGDNSNGDINQGPTLAAFLKSVLTEAYQIHFDGDDWIPHGTFPSAPPGEVRMPPLPGTTSAAEKSVPFQVDKKANGKNSSAWLGRTSYHSAQDIAYSELDTLLSQDHCRKEAEYTPSVFEANQLLKWSEEELQKAVADLKPEWKVKRVQMSIYQMFHEMPKALGLSLLQNRVFHVLCITAHSTPSTSQIQSITLQLPIDFPSFKNTQSVMSKSHIRPGSQTYDNPEAYDRNAPEREKKRNGNKFTEGVYVSVERLVEGEGATGSHRWDMMTKSDAKGITKIAPWSTRRKETLNAIAEDVRYVLDEIKKQRSTRGIDMTAAV